MTRTTFFVVSRSIRTHVAFSPLPTLKLLPALTLNTRLMRHLHAFAEISQSPDR